MYSTKEKMKLLRELYNPEHAEADLLLLREVSPQNDLLKSPIVCAARAAEKILYSLLDHATADRIRLNRRGAEVEKQPEKKLKNENDKEKQPANTTSGEPTVTEQPEGNTSDNPGEDNPDGDTSKVDVINEEHNPLDNSAVRDIRNDTSEVEELADVVPDDAKVAQQLQETSTELEDIKEELESTQAELEETQNELEDTQSELETTKEELEAEKKSEPITKPAPESSKKKVSTRRSTGKTSSTKTSRSRR